MPECNERVSVSHIARDIARDQSRPGYKVLIASSTPEDLLILTRIPLKHTLEGCAYCDFFREVTVQV